MKPLLAVLGALAACVLVGGLLASSSGPSSTIPRFHAPSTAPRVYAQSRFIGTGRLGTPSAPATGDVLFTSNGNWSGSPSSFAYLWQVCNSGTATCSTASGSPTTTNRYVIVAGDSTDCPAATSCALRSRVTATYPGGQVAAQFSSLTATITGAAAQTSNCFASPGICSYPDPTATYSGASAPVGNWSSGGAGVGLNPYTDTGGAAGTAGCASLATQHAGNVTATTNISNENITNGQLIIGANNLTIDNVCVTFTNVQMNGPTSSAAVFTNGFTGTTLKDSIIRGGGTTGAAGSVEIAVGGGAITLNHDYMFFCGECLNSGTGWNVNDSYINDNGDYGVSEHQEDIYINDATATLTHNTLFVPPDTVDATPFQAAELFGDHASGADNAGPCSNHWTVTNNLIAGAGEIINSCGNTGSVGTSVINFSNNHIARCLTPPAPTAIVGGATDGSFVCGTTANAGADSHGYWPYGGYFGVAFQVYCSGGSGQTWTGNTWDDNGMTVACGLDQGTLPPLNTAVPTLSGTTTQGSVLTTTNGSWSGSLPSFTYQWKRCDSGGANCTTISSATAGTYTLQVADVGSTIRSVITATNASGFGPVATSAQSAVIASSGGGLTGTNCFNANSNGTAPKPGVCGLPDPNSAWTATTGVGPNNGSSAVACASLATQHTGDVSTAVNISNENIIGKLTVTGNAVTINNVCVNDPTSNSGENAVTLSGNGDILSNSTVAGSPASCTPWLACGSGVQAAVQGSGTLSHDYLYHCDECIHDGPFTVNNTFVFQNTNFAGDEQEDTYTADHVMSYDHDVMLAPPGGDVPIAVYFDDTHGGAGGACDNNTTITNSLMAGETYIIAACANSSSIGTQILNFQNNNIARSVGGTPDSHGYYTTGGASGVDIHNFGDVTYCGAGTTWTGNRWDDDGSAVNC